MVDFKIHLVLISVLIYVDQDISAECVFADRLEAKKSVSAS